MSKVTLSTRPQALGLNSRNGFLDDHLPFKELGDSIVSISLAAGDAGDMGSIPSLERSPGEGLATHSNILAWKIPWTEEPGKLQSIGLHRVGHNWACMHQQDKKRPADRSLCSLPSPTQGPLESKAASSSQWKACAGLAVRLGTIRSPDRITPV